MIKLYHASPADIESEIHPSSVKVRDASEGPVVFATPFKALAATFSLGHDDRLANQGLVDGKAFVLIGDRERYLAQDKPVHIYEVDPSSFTCDPAKGMGMVEYTSSKPVRILTSEIHHSTIAAMRAYGVTLCFVTGQEYQELRRPENTAQLVKRIRQERRAER